MKLRNFFVFLYFYGCRVQSNVVLILGMFFKSGDIFFSLSFAHSPLLHVCITENTPLSGLLEVILGNIQYSTEISNWSWNRWGRLTEKVNYHISVQNDSWNALNIIGPVISNTIIVFKAGFSFTEQNHYSVSSDENTHKRWNWSQRKRVRERRELWKC